MSFQDRITAQKQKNRFRQRRELQSPQQSRSTIDGKSVLNFCSNNYLGLANHTDIKQAYIDGIEKWGVGSGASHLVNGHTQAHHELEEKIADWQGRDRALLFSTGYMANLAIASALVGKGDTLIQDKLNHASMIDAGQLSAAQSIRYIHGDMSSLERQCQRGRGQQLIMTDAVFSMDGDIAPLQQMTTIANKHDSLLMVDDAHGIGVLGAKGQGTLSHLNLTQDDVPVLMATLGKAMGGFGAFVAGPDELIESLIQFGRSYIYTTATPPAMAVATSKAIDVIQQESWRQEKLSQNIALFTTLALDAGLSLMPSETAIQPVVVGDDKAAVTASENLFEKGFHVGAIRPPTVPEGSARLRVTLSCEHSEKEISLLIDAMSTALNC